jgi:hypothetical protein
MKVTRLVAEQNGWRRFDLSIGGFVVKNCRWHEPTRWVSFPRRYDQRGNRHPIVHAHPAHVKRLRALLESGEVETPRDRRPCTFKIHFLGRSRTDRNPWLIFNFTVHGFTILGCRWQPESCSIQLPVSFTFDENGIGKPRGPWRKKQVVCAFGPHILRLREALEARLQVNGAFAKYVNKNMVEARG